MIDADRTVARLDGVSHRYGKVCALEDVTLVCPAGAMVGVIGPDGVGKSSLLALIAGARRVQSGRVQVLGGDMAHATHRDAVCVRVAYMPQGLGKNLYADLSVRENIEFFARLFGQDHAERARRIDQLLAATGLAPFPDRAAKNLSGGMRQKLGLCCALVHDPDLLILDEPTTGVDPLSRRQFWDLIAGMRARRPDLSVIVATAYMEEAERFDRLIAMNAGRILAVGTPDELKKRTATRSIEDAFIALLPETLRAGHGSLDIPPRRQDGDAPAIVARDLTRRFDGFTAVDHVSFTIERGEIFGFLGSNGCGKTTTMKMLTGLLPASEGTALLMGRPIDATDMNSRRRVGYMSQSFSLYTELTVAQNLDLHARLFHLPRARAKARIAALVGRFGLADYLDQRTLALPLGIRQRLSLAVAIVHEPDVLILDEPTSGVDPLARDSFWALLVDLARNHGVTIFVSTHFMNEAMRCDRVALMEAGRVLATDAPAALIAARGVRTLEEAFIAYLEEAGGVRWSAQESAGTGIPATETRRLPVTRFSLQRLLAYSRREGLELMRDPIRLGFALLGTAFLMLIFGFGITTDVDSLSFAVLDRDRTPESRAYIEEFSGSRYFQEKPPLADYGDLERRLRTGQISASIEIPPGFGRDVRGGRPTEIGAWVDGAMPFRAETIRQYLQGVHAQFLGDLAASLGTRSAPAAATIAPRFRYNQDFDSINAMVPSTIALMLMLFPAILMALAVVREKELGSIVNLYVTPVRRIEFLLGKQLPYIALALVNFIVLFLMAVIVFGVPFKGSFPTLALGAVFYVAAATAYGMLISAFTRTQIAALFGTAILTMVPAITFSGMLSPVSSLDGMAAVMARGFPMTYFLHVSVGTFTKGLGLYDLRTDITALALTVPALLLAGTLLLRKQER